MAYEEWASRVSELTDGSVEIEIFGQESLLAAPDILPGVASGRADMGGTSYIYHPAELPLSHIVNVPYQTENMPAEAKAFAELYENNEAYKAEFDNQDVHLLFNWIVGPPLFGCNEPVQSLADLRGRDMRVGGLVAAAFEAVGVNVVTVPAPEIRESVERGLIDCWAGIPLDVVPDFGLEEVTSYIYDSGYQNYGQFHLVINQGVWDSLGEEQRAAMEQASEEILDRTAELTDQVFKTACESIQGSEATLERLPEPLIAEWRELAEQPVKDAFFDLTEQAGVDGESFYSDYESAVAEYEEEYPDYESAVTRCIEGRL